MLDSISLSFSETGALTLPVEGVTIFVGPNNSGKSLVLREFMEMLRVHPFPQGLRILTDYEVRWPSVAEIDAILERNTAFQRTGTPAGHAIIGSMGSGGGLESTTVSIDAVKEFATNKSEKRWIATQFLRWGAISLDGRSRFNLTNDQPSGDLLGPPGNILQQLFRDDALRKRVEEVIYDAFGLHFTIDPTGMTVLRIRLAREKPAFNVQSLDSNARSFYQAAHYIKELSDGIQAFTGIVTAVYSGEYDTILVDEPEAFLHPPLARKLGKNLAKTISERGGALLASTHSPEFLMGCVQGSKNVRVVRLEYQGGKSRARLVDPSALETLFRNPIMRSANVASGLFYDGVIVTESDNDRAFYAEIFYRLAASHDGYPSVLFVNAQNKQTMRDIVGPLRTFGVPTAAIADIDVVKDGGADWVQWQNSLNVPSVLQTGFGPQRANIKDLLANSGRDMKRDGGLSVLSGKDRVAASQFFDQLDRYGLFAVRVGEVENWLAHLNVRGRKTGWALNMLEALGSDPADSSYVHPAADDVWGFIAGIVGWIQNASRLGMP